MNPGPDVDYTEYLKIRKCYTHNVKFVVFNCRSLQKKLNQLQCFAANLGPNTILGITETWLIKKIA